MSGGYTELTNAQIDALHEIAIDECAKNLGIPIDALRTNTAKVPSFRRTFARVIEFAARANEATGK